MDAKEAVSTAKKYVQDMFSEERIVNLGLEEVEFDDSDRAWHVTLGFSRPWDEPRSVLAGLGDVRPKRAYKVIRISDASGKVISVKNYSAAS